MERHDEIWNGWYFEYGFFCSPAGDKFTPETLLACIFTRQMEAYKSVLYTKPHEQEIN